MKRSGVGSKSQPDSKTEVRGGMPVRLSVPELMALRNAAANGGLIVRGDIRDAMREKLRGLGLIERRQDVVIDKDKFAAAIRQNRRELATLPKPAGDYQKLQQSREILYRCCDRLRNCLHSGVFLTELGKQYAAKDIEIVLPGQRTNSDTRTTHPNPAAQPNSTTKES